MSLIAELHEDNETPSGTINGTNKVFTLLFSPSPTTAIRIYRNGILTVQSEDFSLAGAQITFINAPAKGTILKAFYRH